MYFPNVPLKTLWNQKFAQMQVPVINIHHLQGIYKASNECMCVCVDIHFYMYAFKYELLFFHIINI